MTWWSMAWGFLFGIGLILEGVALYRQHAGDTLSEQVWELRTRRWGRLILLPAWGWLTWHFFLEPGSLGPAADIWWDDLTVIVACLTLGAMANYADTTQRLTDGGDPGSDYDFRAGS